MPSFSTLEAEVEAARTDNVAIRARIFYIATAVGGRTPTQSTVKVDFNILAESQVLLENFTGTQLLHVLPSEFGLTTLLRTFQVEDPAVLYTAL